MAATRWQLLSADNDYTPEASCESRFEQSQKTSSGQLTAQAWTAAERQDKADAMADELFGLNEITETSCHSAAEKIRLNLSLYEADFADSAIQSHLNQTAAWVTTAETQGLPQLWIKNVVVIGEPREAGLKAAMRRAVFPVQSRNEP